MTSTPISTAAQTAEEGPDAAFVERRAEPRVPVNTAARIFFGSSLDRWVDVTLKDRSASGMKVFVPAIVQLPSFLIILDFAGDAAFHAQRRWQKGDMAGLRLTGVIDLPNLADPRLEVVKKAWISLKPGLAPSSGPRDPNMIG